MNTIDFCGIPVVRATRTEFAEFAHGEILAYRRGELTKPKLVFSLNGQSLAKSKRLPGFKELLNKADYIHADGMFIVMSSSWVSPQVLPERIATTDWFHDIVKLGIDSQVKHYLLGAAPEILETVVSKLKTTYPGIQLVGYHHGYFSASEEDSVIQDIKNSGAEVVWIGLGRPKQEAFALRLQSLGIGYWLKTCGGLFDHVSEIYPRAPIWMQKSGLEWFFRLSQEPRRLFKRYLWTNVISILVVLKYAFFRR